MIDFFIKLFKAFNSSQTPWQMSLAISLGMAMGLTPFSGWQSILIIFIVLIVNVHIGLFIVSSVFFGGVAYLFDPAFESLGHAILTTPALADVFTSMYNSSILRTTYFNNTLVMGSSVVAFLLLVPMYFILNAVVYIYRDKIASTLQKYKIFKTLGISVSGKKDRFLRFWGFGVFALLGGLSAAFVLVFLDPIAKMALESSISSATDKDVEIKNVNVSLKEGSLNIDDLNIFKDGISSLQADMIKVDLDFNQLLFNRYHIENMIFKGLEFDQVTDAKAKSKEVSKKSEDSDAKSGFEFDSSSLPKPETLVARANLSSTKNYEKALNKFDSIESKYKSVVEKDFSDQELERIKADAKRLEKNFRELKDIKKLKPEHLTKLNQTFKDAKKLQKELKAKKESLSKLNKEFKKDKKALSELSKSVIEGAKGDYENLAQNYQFNKQGGVNVVGVLFGEDIKGYTSTFLKYYNMAKPYLKSEETPPAPPRGEGRWIRFKELNSQVDLLVKNIDVDGVYKLNKFDANMKNITSNQKLLNKPFEFKLTSDGDVKKEIDFGLTKLENAKLRIDAKAKTMDYVEILSDTKLKYSNAKFSSKELDDLKSFNIDIKLSEKITSPKVKITSDLDDKLKDIFSKVIKQKLKEYKEKLKSIIDGKTKEQLSKLGLKIDEIEKLNTLIGGSIDDYSSTDKQLEKLQDEIEKKSKDAIENKAKEKVGDLLKSFKF